MGVVKRNRFVRRGSVDAPPFVIDTSGGAAAEKRIAADLALLQPILDEPGTSAEIATAARAWLDGDPDAAPIGAAAIVPALGIHINHPESVEEIFTPIADVWIARRGLVFAARAAIEHALLICHERERVDVAYRGPLYLTSDQGILGFRGPVEEILLRVRAAVAVASDTEYAEVVEAARPYRERGRSARIATSILLPGEHDWVEQDIAEPDATIQCQSLLYAAGTRAQAEILTSNLPQIWYGSPLPFIATIADGVGPGAARALLTWFEIPYVDASIQQRILAVLVELDGDEVITELLARLDRKYVPAAVLDAAARFPARAMRLFAEAGSPLLRAHVFGHLDLVDEVLPSLSAEAAKRVHEVADAAADVAYAPADAIPPVLASPPRLGLAKPSKPVAFTGLSCEDPATIEWRSGERDRWLNTAGDWGRPWGTWEKVAEYLVTGENDWHAQTLFTGGPDELARPLLSTWRAGQAAVYDQWLKVAAARFGLDALPLLQVAAERVPTLAEVLLPYTSPAIAVLMADRYARVKSARAAALAWLLRHAGSAARALIPAALGKAGAARRQAETALLALPADTVRTAAAGYGPAAAAVIDTLLARDPLTLLPAKLPARPAWAVPAILPPVRLRDGSGALPPAAVDALITMLAVSRMDEPYAGVALAAEACEPGDLAAFVWGLLDAWQLAGADPKQSWVLDALALLGDDTTVQRLTPLILAWPGEGGHTKAVTGVRVLATIGTGTALMRLYGISQRARFKALKTAAQEKITEVADSLGLTAEQLADRLVPDFGLAADGGMTLDYGSRQFTVGFDEQLKPYVTDASGKRLAALPKPSTPLAEETYQRFAALKKEVRTVGADQVRRLEQAMASGRRWTPEDFTSYFAGHPLLRHIVRRLVWTVSNGDSFRVCEDSTYADGDDEPYTPPADVTVGVAHPLDLGETAAAWGAILADYEIVQPFPQLGRETYPAADIGRVIGAEVPSTRVLGLERRGWRREAPQDAGVQGRIERIVGGLTVVVELDPGIPVGEPDLLGDQKLEDVHVHGTPGRQPFSALGPVAASEVIRDLMLIIG